MKTGPVSQPKGASVLRKGGEIRSSSPRLEANKERRKSEQEANKTRFHHRYIQKMTNKGL